MKRRVGTIATYIAVAALLLMPAAIAVAGPAVAFAGSALVGEQAERIGSVGLVGAIMESIALGNTGVDEDALYTVMVDRAGRFMIWPASERQPMGWQVVSAAGSRADCLAYIEASPPGASVQ
jgi:uncharacterized protein YbdZ (MbtH family)